MKRFVLLTLVTLMVMSVTTMCLAEPADEYELNPAGWPDRHWEYMTQDEITAFEAAGWQRYVGVLWYNDSNYKYAPEVDTADAISIADVEAYYDQGYSFHVIYHWLMDGRLIGKQTEQSVYVGRWRLSREQAVEYFENNLTVPALMMNVKPLPEYYSLWYYNGKECSVPEKDDPLYKFVRIAYDCYDLGFGSKIWLRNGEYALNDETGNNYFTYAEYWGFASTGFDYEMPHWE